MLDHVAAEWGEQPRWSHAPRNLFVLDGNEAPATLVEIGYLTNPRTGDLPRRRPTKTKWLPHWLKL
ncbi:MAG: hypothetical protein IPI39_12365 [Candidatus Obscuribacter sp.]|nr:hypothetical protein [Candidatus Obscuribacter sp.]